MTFSSYFSMYVSISLLVSCGSSLPLDGVTSPQLGCKSLAWGHWPNKCALTNPLISWGTWHSSTSLIALTRLDSLTSQTSSYTTTILSAASVVFSASTTSETKSTSPIAVTPATSRHDISATFTTQDFATINGISFSSLPSYPVTTGTAYKETNIYGTKTSRAQGGDTTTSSTSMTAISPTVNLNSTTRLTVTATRTITVSPSTLSSVTSSLQNKTTVTTTFNVSKSESTSFNIDTSTPTTLVDATLTSNSPGTALSTDLPTWNLTYFSQSQVYNSASHSTESSLPNSTTIDSVLTPSSANITSQSATTNTSTSTYVSILTGSSLEPTGHTSGNFTITTRITSRITRTVTLSSDVKPSDTRSSTTPLSSPSKSHFTTPPASPTNCDIQSLYTTVTEHLTQTVCIDEFRDTTPCPVWPSTTPINPSISSTPIYPNTTAVVGSSTSSFESVCSNATTTAGARTLSSATSSVPVVSTSTNLADLTSTPVLWTVDATRNSSMDFHGSTPAIESEGIHSTYLPY